MLGIMEIFTLLETWEEILENSKTIQEIDKQMQPPIYPDQD